VYGLYRPWGYYADVYRFHNPCNRYADDAYRHYSYNSCNGYADDTYKHYNHNYYNHNYYNRPLRLHN
jgi:hypothetical protein